MPLEPMPYYSAAAAIGGPFSSWISGDDEVQKGSFENATVAVSLRNGVTNIREGKLEFDLSNPHFITIDGKKLAIGIDTDEVFLEHGPTCDVVGELPKVAVDSAAAVAAPEGTLGRKVRINVEGGDDAVFAALEKLVAEANLGPQPSFDEKMDQALDDFADKMGDACDRLQVWLDSWAEDPATSLEAAEALKASQRAQVGEHITLGAVEEQDHEDNEVKSEGTQTTHVKTSTKKGGEDWVVL
ncbi:hypothetical protein Pmar_PMAR009152 [Perkinsus marinus ATCC 50983]|uniref:Uncharacterized protein n=1 Tax=Perkinsus marinus (strain ATCC 50983 / TXsc) TaxID=423536 RepID=C5KBK6_PERM5|nr:hypothetical protein Pmar_PMAR009152 [Perkinsus marinus ATCC 50983]EER18126.1 hypothetical protein Pmar_PMAR009152 [Perkinsus marinus ATCC 50983]|eukprot:XP_002786330.1 hypothetical protein Pmar_PMAR009152 [Perkinsus marinus ATCC 50983]